MMSSVIVQLRKLYIEVSKRKRQVVLSLVVYLSICQLFVVSNRRWFNSSNVVSALEIHVSRLIITAGKWSDGMQPNSDLTLIAVGGAITSKGVINSGNRTTNSTDINGWIDKFPLFTVLLPSFCQTASLDNTFQYRFYFAYDFDDERFSDFSQRSAFINAFNQHVNNNSRCRSALFPVSIKLVECSYSDKPAWSQNDAMLDAYLDGAEFFYRINDDTQMATSRWTETFINKLYSFSPPLVGVVGPHHTGGNEFILTYDFVHRTHIDLFGFYYPRVFTNWFADNWITLVYQPNRCVKLSSVKLVHTMSLGRRYTLNKTATLLTMKQHKLQVNEQVQQHRPSLNRFVNLHKTKSIKNISCCDVEKRFKVVSMSLSSSCGSRRTWHVFRSVQLSHLLFPDWTVRVYVDSRLHVTSPRVVTTLERLGVQIATITTQQSGSTRSTLAARHWHLLALDDVTVDTVLAVDSRWELGERDVEFVADWLDRTQQNSDFALHTMCDQHDTSGKRTTAANSSDSSSIAGVFRGCCLLLARPVYVRQIFAGTSIASYIHWSTDFNDNSQQRPPTEHKF